MTEILERHCAIGRITVAATLRNAGASLGLGYPFIGGEAWPGTWLVWNRHTGRVVSVVFDRNRILGEHQTYRTLEALNGCWRHSMEMNVLHDLET